MALSFQNGLGTVLQSVSRRQTQLWKWAFMLSITYFVAKGVNIVVTYKFLPITIPSQASQPMTLNASTEGAQKNIALILSRNLFNSDARASGGLSSGINDNEVFPSTLAAELVGTVVFKNSKYSVALIADRNARTSGYYAVNDHFQGARIRKIERFRVIMENAGRLESLDLKAAASKLPAMRAPVQSSPGKGPVELEEIGPNRFLIPQNTLDETLNNFSKVLTEARMIPNLTADNKTDGFKVFQIKPGSVYDTLGMLNNDIIKRVNGVDLDSFEKATGLFTALRNEKTISLDIVRDGVRINYTYEIR